VSEEPATRTGRTRRALLIAVAVLAAARALTWRSSSDRDDLAVAETGAATSEPLLPGKTSTRLRT
jgi:hypothetical protein